MIDEGRTPVDDPSSDPSGSGSEGDSAAPTRGPVDRGSLEAESGSWGTTALLILSALFVIAAAATVHSVLATLL